MQNDLNNAAASDITDLLSVVVHLASAKGTALPRGHGRLIHGWFLVLIGDMDRALAAELHGDQPNKPFTLSLLTREEPRHSEETDRARYRLRLTSLDRRLGTVLRTLGTRLPKSVTLAGVELITENMITAQERHPFASCHTYQILWHRWMNETAPPRHIPLRFLSPTTFTADRENVPLPIPRNLFGGLAQKWNAHAPADLALVDPEALVGSAWIARYRLHTEYLDYGDYGQVGFVGDCEFEIPRGTPVEIACWLNLLADFVFYAGVGYKTTMGMGQVMRSHLTTWRRKDGSAPCPAGDARAVGSGGR